MRVLVLYYLIVQLLKVIVQVKGHVTVVTVASNVTKLGYKKFLLSAKANGIPVKNINENGQWNYTSTKIYLFRKFLANFESENTSDHIILFVDSYDVIFLSGLNEIINKFKRFTTTKVLFSAELYCSPLPELAKRYSRADKATVYPYLNSGGFIGYLPHLKRILNYKTRAEGEDDQLFYTYIYLDKSLRKSFQITLDHDATVFMSLAGANRHIEIVNTMKGYRVNNIVTRQRPPIIHGQGSPGRSKLKQLYKKYFGPQFENIVNPGTAGRGYTFKYKKVS